MPGILKAHRQLILPRQLLFGIGVCILALLLLSAKNMFTLQAMNTDNNDLYQDELLPISHVKEANASLFDIERSLKRMILAQSGDQRAAARSAIVKHEQTFQAEIKEAKQGISRPENIRRISSVETLFAVYKNNIDHALWMMERENVHGDNPIDYVLSEDFQQIVRSIDQLLDDVVASKEAVAMERIEESQTLYKQGLMISALIVAATLCFGIVTLYLFYSALMRPLEYLREAADGLASGNLDSAIPYTKNDSAIGNMARTISRIQGNIRALKEQFREHAERAACSDAERASTPDQKDTAEKLLTQPANFGSESSPLCLSTHAYMNALGESLHLRGNPGAAEMPLRSALTLIPNSLAALANLAKTFYSRGQFRNAETCLRRSLSIDPYFDEALYRLSLLLANTSRPEVAEHYQRRLLALTPGHEGALLLMKHFHAQQGRFEQSETATRRALAVNPRSPAAMAEFMHLRKMTPADAEWLGAAEKLVKAILPIEEFQLRYAMGKFCDDTEDYERAFDHFHRANELSKTVANGQYQPDAWTDFVDCLIRVNSPVRVSQICNGASASRRPVFIVGMPRSGTTLVEQILASHPAVFGAGELGFWDTVASRTPDPVLEEALSEETLRQLSDGYLKVLTSVNRDAARVVDKMPGNFRYLGLIRLAFPNAKIIHTLRNPIDTCLSIYFQNFSAAYGYANDLTNLAHYYREYHRLMAHWRALLPADAFLELRYEDLLADQEGMSRKMIAFIDLEWDECCLNYHDTQRRVATASKWQVRQKMYSTSVERWRHYAKHLAPLMGLLELRN